MADFEIVIGNKRYSSWSLRGWLAVRLSGVPFTETVIPLDQPATSREIAEHAGAGPRLVPVLKHGGLTIWDSLAILEYMAEQAPAGQLWPADAAARAVARSVAAEMHSGFRALRGELPMNLGADKTGQTFSDAVQADIDRIAAVWRHCLEEFGSGGPFLFGHVTGADVAYAPVVTRFKTYGVALEPALQAYVDAVLDLPAMREWYAGAAAEPWVSDKY